MVVVVVVVVAAAAVARGVIETGGRGEHRKHPSTTHMLSAPLVKPTAGRVAGLLPPFVGQLGRCPSIIDHLIKMCLPQGFMTFLHMVVCCPGTGEGGLTAVDLTNDAPFPHHGKVRTVWQRRKSPVRWGQTRGVVIIIIIIIITWSSPNPPVVWQ